jgi:hypothetical protein
MLGIEHKRPPSRIKNKHRNAWRAEADIEKAPKWGPQLDRQSRTR